jgi:pimeloyl-ACP methyl ester carboxylesterase
MIASIETREVFELDGQNANLVANQDTMVRGTYHRPAAGRFSGQPNRNGQGRIGLVFLNSLSPTRAANGDAAVDLADSFARLGYPAFRLDLPGFGDSEGDPPPDLQSYVNLGQYAPLASAKLDELAARFDLAGVILVGHCAGTVNVLYTAAASGISKGIILMGAYFHLPAGSAIPAGMDPALTVSEDASLPENANHALLRAWKKLTATGLPILMLKEPERKAPRAQAKIGEFDYLDYVVKIAGPHSRVELKVSEGANHSFGNHLGKLVVREQTTEWLQEHFPLGQTSEATIDPVHLEQRETEAELETASLA